MALTPLSSKIRFQLMVDTFTFTIPMIGVAWSPSTQNAYMKLRMRYHLARTVNRLNIEHRTSNIERRMLMTLRFIDFKTSEPQTATIRLALGSQPN